MGKNNGRIKRCQYSSHGIKNFDRNNIDEELRWNYLQNCTGILQTSFTHVLIFIDFNTLLLLLRNISYHKKLVCSPDVDKIDMKRTLEQAIKTNGLETDIRNIVFQLLRASNKCDTKNPVQCVRIIF